MKPLAIGHQDHCMFCGKRGREVFGFAIAPGMDAQICDECVKLCLDIIAKEQAAGAGVPAPAGGPSECAFCGRAREEAEKIIYGPSVHICDRCVGEAHVLLAASPALAEASR